MFTLRQVNGFVEEYTRNGTADAYFRETKITAISLVLLFWYHFDYVLSSFSSVSDRSKQKQSSVRTSLMRSNLNLKLYY